MIQSITKRDGRVVLYDQNKIASAILRALEAAHEGDAADAARVANDVQRDLEGKYASTSPNIEQIQDAVERQLMNHGFSDAAKAYILYRATRTRAREANTSLIRTIEEITHVDARKSDMKRDNANIDGNTAMGSMLQIGSAGAKAYNEMYLLRPEHARAYREGDIHIHDFDFYSLTSKSEAHPADPDRQWLRPGRTVPWPPPFFPEYRRFRTGRPGSCSGGTPGKGSPGTAAYPCRRYRYPDTGTPKTPAP